MRLGRVLEQYGLDQFSICDSDLTQCSADEAQCQTDNSQCQAALTTCQADPLNQDADGDGVRDGLDICSTTSVGASVDTAGCSLDQFCALVDVSLKENRKVCKKSDWQNDEPVMRGKERDCDIDKGGSGLGDDRCVPVP